MDFKLICDAFGVDLEQEQYACKKVKRVVIDSREVITGDLFVPIVGENFDGHDFIHMAVKNGALAVVSARDVKVDVPVIKVKDTKEAFLKIANLYRNFYDVKVVAITGSVGKTSTKEVVYGVVSRLGKTLKNEGNLNNEIGVPITLCKLDETYEYAVIEMGMDHFGEIETLAKAVEPNVGIITNIGTSHIGNLGSRENIFKAKTEMLPYIKDEILIVCGDDDFLPSLKNSYKNVITYGKGENNDAIVKNIDVTGKTFSAVTKKASYNISHNLYGAHNALNALAGICVGEYYGLSVDEIQKGIALSSLTGSRMNVIEKKGKKIIDDCYNASYESMTTAIDFFDEVVSGKSVVIFGDIFELGEFTKHNHERVGELAIGSKADICVFVGKNSEYGYKKAVSFKSKKCYYFERTENLVGNLDLIIDCDTFLIKASRGMHFEMILNGLLERLEDEINN